MKDLDFSTRSIQEAIFSYDDWDSQSDKLYEYTQELEFRAREDEEEAIAILHDLYGGWE